VAGTTITAAITNEAVDEWGWLSAKRHPPS
jgi:hypothetical protein